MHHAAPRLAPGERFFLTAIALSMVGHLVVVGIQLIRLKRYRRTPTPQEATAVVYEHAALTHEVQQLHDQLAQASQRSEAASSAPALQVRLPDRMSIGGSGTFSGGGARGPSVSVGLGAGRSMSLPDIASPSRAAVVDLTNVVEAAQGDPVLLSYFSAIRERIQQTANHQAWFSGEASQGLVYVSFIMSSAGQVQSASVVADRSVSSRGLQAVAMDIIKAASPFPPFPPSFNVPQKTIVVPLEFLSGS